MEDFFYVILLVLWVVVSLYKRSAKAKQAKPDALPKAKPDFTTALPKEADLESMLEDFFGGGKKAPAPEPVMSAEEPVMEGYESMEDGRSYDTAQYDSAQTIERAAEPAYESWESRAQQSYNDSQERSIPELYTEPAYESFYSDATLPDHSGFLEMEKVASVEELIKAHAAKDAMEQARSEMEYGSGPSADIPEFDLRTAVIFSEILNKKYT